MLISHRVVQTIKRLSGSYCVLWSPLPSLRRDNKPRPRTRRYEKTNRDERRPRPNGKLSLRSRGESKKRGIVCSRKPSGGVWRQRRSVKRRRSVFGKRNENGLARSFGTN